MFIIVRQVAQVLEGKMNDRIGGAVARRPLHFIWLLDVSGSMAVAGKIQALNFALEETLPLLREDAADNPGAQMYMRVLTFATAPVWLFRDPVPIESFRWEPVAAVPQGLTELGSALMQLAEPMRELAAVGRGFAPAIVLVSDGKPTHATGPTFADGMAALMAEPWGQASIRMAVGIGEDADMDSLARFIDHSDRTPLRASNQADLVAMIQWVSRQASRVASRPAEVARPVEGPISSTSDPVWNAQTL